jgi:hypothetical protein
MTAKQEIATSDGTKLSYDDVKQQVTSYGQQINQYLEKVGARLESYKFDVLKVPNGISLDLEFKASFSMKKNETTGKTN